jgi:hypothetical protein
MQIDKSRQQLKLRGTAAHVFARRRCANRPLEAGGLAHPNFGILVVIEEVCLRERSSRLHEPLHKLNPLVSGPSSPGPLNPDSKQNRPPRMFNETIKVDRFRPYK